MAAWLETLCEMPAELSKQLIKDIVYTQYTHYTIKVKTLKLFANGLYAWQTNQRFGEKGSASFIFRDASALIFVKLL